MTDLQNASKLTTKGIFITGCSVFLFIKYDYIFGSSYQEGQSTKETK